VDESIFSVKSANNLAHVSLLRGSWIKGDADLAPHIRFLDQLRAVGLRERNRNSNGVLARWKIRRRNLEKPSGLLCHGLQIFCRVAQASFMKLQAM
jgi:hypothetical protein